MNTVVLITNKEDIKETLGSNLVLLRESDEILCSSYDDAPDLVHNKRPDIVIIHENEDRSKTINLVKYFKEKKVFDNTNIILLVDKYDRDFILNAYDEGIDDYFSMGADPSEMLIRTINVIKKSEKNKELKRLKYYLSTYGILSDKSGFISAKFSKEIFELELINNDFADGSFMIIAPDDEGKKVFSDSKMNLAIRNSIRIGDLVSEFSGSKYYLLLDSGISGAVAVLNKIKAQLPEELSLKAGLVNVSSKKFEEIEKKATCALNEALMDDKDYVVYSEKLPTSDDWLVEDEDNAKSYKFFRGVYCKKLEKVIAPVFYRLQSTYEEKLINTKIEQYTDEKQSVFCLINSRCESRLKIVYPGFSKVIVYIVHSGLDSPENREISLPINKITYKEISDIVEDFINEFIEYINKETF